ncbi:LuxR C-terminal-related transcriptional regulator [Streptomyces sp. NPDC057486]|uniref:LuxR C-terminal-related transcriptional regulator n=1 Tax=Streptomyces sp. NPDC057486 TaxID=3346145 RepID=UPI00369C1F4D
MLTTLGLDQETETLYRAMLTHPAEGVAALCERLGMPEQSVRRGLDRLSELALVRPSQEEPGQIRAVSPEIGMEMLLARQQAELATQQQRIEASRAAAARLIAECADLRPTTTHPGVEHLVGLDHIRDRLNQLERDVRQEVMIFSPQNEHIVAGLEQARPRDEALLRRGIKMRTIYLDSIRNCPPIVEYAQWLTSLGRQARTAATLPTRMIIMDRTSAVIPVNADDTAAAAVVLSGHGTLTALCALFESTWTNATPLGTNTPRNKHNLTDTESTTLKLLAQGHTDETIAKRLGVSHRTARRTATTLMERLNARSRFEAGVKATQLGWLQ